MWDGLHARSGWPRRMVQLLQVKVVMKEVADTQYVACMNPTAGSFHVTPRMQRHFVTLAVHMPSPDTIRSVTPAQTLA